MRLIDEYGRVLRKAWSVRFGILSGLFGGLEAFLPLFSDAMPRGVFAVMALLASTGSVVSRIVAQKEMHDGDE